ncbi:hypothetical protein NDU88_000853 [Pleurodeles waltl]|uniref:Uncharacterized protein n=1 Tax=Pleurodeles waltl TaxID=8319 RepID=A0AAV7VYH9_PLEWA|nr:hypothetical protein NDU88_000853 [Pleurodeles waltl]
MLYHQAALTIQAFYRGYRVRRDLHSEISPGPRQFTERVTTEKRADFGHIAKRYGANMLEKNVTCQSLWECPVENHYQYDTAYRRSPPNVYLDKYHYSEVNNKNPAGRLTQFHQKKAGQIPAVKDRSYRETYPYIDTKMKNHAATIIQAAYRGFMVRRLFLELKFASTVIQAFWRGYATRKKLGLMDNSAGQAHCLDWTSLEHKKSPGYSYDCAKIPNKLDEVMTTIRKYNTPKVSSQEVAFSKISKREGFRLQDPNLGGSVYWGWPNNEDKVRKGRDIANLQIKMTQTEHHTGHLMNGLECTNQDSFLRLDTWQRAKQPCPEYCIRRRKSREQLRKEHISAAKIQSAWKGYLVRKEIKEMSKAVTKIQAFYRGFRVRQALQLDNDTTAYHRFIVESTKQKPLNMGLHSKGKVEPHRMDTLQAYSYQDRPSSKVQVIRGRMVAADKTFSKNSLSSNFDHPSTQTIYTSHQCFCTPHNITIATPQSVSGNALANHCFESRRPLHGSYLETRIHPSRNGYHVSKQISELHKAATRIQAFYRGYKTRLFLKQTGLLSFGRLREAAGDAITYQMANSKEREMPLERRQGACAGCRANPTKECIASHDPVSPICNINVSTVVRNGQSFQRPPISIRVSSPNGIVYGYFKSTTEGAEGHYMIRTSSMRQPSKILVNVNMVTMK